LHASWTGQAATTLAEAQDPDAAVLDIFLEGAYVWQLARSLVARGVPFIFQTGFRQHIEIPEEFTSVPRLGKPLMHGALKLQLLAIL
jgi:CheY-like chemotaxis protein